MKFASSFWPVSSSVTEFRPPPCEPSRSGLNTTLTLSPGLIELRDQTSRVSTPGLAYADPTFGSQVTAKAQALYGLWRETIRYHKNIAYFHEMARARDAAEWLLIRSPDL